MERPQQVEVRDRAEMAHVHGTSWGSDVDRTTVEQFAAEIAVRAGFRVCAVEVLRADGMLEFVAVHGAEAGRDLPVGRVAPYTVLEPVINCGATYGPLTFVAAEWMTASATEALDRYGYVPDRVVPPRPDAWRNEDMLVVRLSDDLDVLRGLLHLDDPESGRRPTGADLVRLCDDLHLTFRAVVSVVEREELAQRVRLADAARKVIRQASAQMKLSELLTLASDQLREGFHARDLQFHLRPGDGYRLSPSDAGLTPTTFHAINGAVEHAWREETVVIVEEDRVSGDGGLLEGAAQQELGRNLAAAGVCSMVMVPIGSADVHLGMMVIQRGPDTQPWTVSESVAALEVGHDLARAVLNARAHEREQRLTEELMRLDSYRTQMVATVTHELRNPLGVILGHLELLESDPALPSGWARSLTAIGKAAGRLDTLAEDLLTLSRVDATGQPPNLDPVDLGEVVEEAVELAQIEAQRRGVVVVVEHGHGPYVVQGERAELARVVTNLLSNGIKYSDPGDQVVLGLEADARAVVLFCRDEGLGISDADQTMMFEEFFRSTNRAALQRPGTGLGLPILRRIVERHGGRVSLTSALGVGSTFTVTLPKRRHESVADC